MCTNTFVWNCGMSDFSILSFCETLELRKKRKVCLLVGKSRKPVDLLVFHKRTLSPMKSVYECMIMEWIKKNEENVLAHTKQRRKMDSGFKPSSGNSIKLSLGSSFKPSSFLVLYLGDCVIQAWISSVSD